MSGTSAPRGRYRPPDAPLLPTVQAMDSASGVLLCVATRKGLEVLRAALDARGPTPLWVSTIKESGVETSHDDAIVRTAQQGGAGTVAWPDFRRDPVEFLRRHGVGAILCAGWRYLIPAEAIEALRGNVIIAHDSLLPRLRGFAPLPTALIIGEPRSGVTFLRVGKDIDDGPILWQESFPIEPGDTIAALVEKTLPLYREGATRFFQGTLGPERPQDERLASYSIWRDEEDYRLDWSRDAETLERTVRALGPPYLGARCVWKGRTIVVHRAEVVPDVPLVIRQPGKVWRLDASGCPSVVCGRGMLKILEAHEADGEGRSILPLGALRTRFA